MPTRIPPPERTTWPGNLALPTVLPGGPGVSISPATPRTTQPGGGVGLCPGGCEDPDLDTSGKECLHGQRLAHTQPHWEGSGGGYPPPFSGTLACFCLSQHYKDALPQMVLGCHHQFFCPRVSSSCVRHRLMTNGLVFLFVTKVRFFFSY